MFWFEKFTRDEEVDFDVEAILVASALLTYIEAPSRDQLGLR